MHTAGLSCLSLHIWGDALLEAKENTTDHADDDNHTDYDEGGHKDEDQKSVIFVPVKSLNFLILFCGRYAGCTYLNQSFEYIYHTRGSSSSATRYLCARVCLFDCPPMVPSLLSLQPNLFRSFEL
jgi:hypothetical protein